MALLDRQKIRDDATQRALQTIRSMSHQEIEADPSLAIQGENTINHFVSTVQTLIELPLDLAERFAATDAAKAKAYLFRKLDEYQQPQTEGPNHATTLAVQILSEHLAAAGIERDTRPALPRYSDFSPEERAAAKQAGFDALDAYRAQLSDEKIQEDDYLKHYFDAHAGRNARESALHQMLENRAIFEMGLSERSASFDGAIALWKQTQADESLSPITRESVKAMLDAYFDRLGIDPSVLAKHGTGKG